MTKGLLSVTLVSGRMELQQQDAWQRPVVHIWLIASFFQFIQCFSHDGQYEDIVLHSFRRFQARTMRARTRRSLLSSGGWSLDRNTRQHGTLLFVWRMPPVEHGQLDPSLRDGEEGCTWQLLHSNNLEAFPRSNEISNKTCLQHDENLPMSV